MICAYQLVTDESVEADKSFNPAPGYVNEPVSL